MNTENTTEFDETVSSIDETPDLTDKVVTQFKRILKTFGGIINPYLWAAILAVILIGQSLTVQIFIYGMLGLSIYFKWFHGDNNIIRRYANSHSNNIEKE